ncbi:MAG: phosphoadenylyl-sulfate reductase [Gemmatimonadota bacterium]
MIAIKDPLLMNQLSLAEDVGETDARGIIEWAVESIEPGRLIVSTSFGPSGLVNLHMLSEVAPEVPVVFVDTLYHFEETLQLAEQVRQHYDLNLRIYRPAETREEFEREHGERLWERDIERFHHLTKVEPMARALEGVRGWITGRRRDQSVTRADMPVVEVGDHVKINPVAAWGRGDVWRFILDHDIPYNPLHDMGYASIGDEPLTTPIHMGEDERAGRWRGQARTECGLHDLT